jgi:histidine triad (HIT) family protein
MYNHATEEYSCPICLAAEGIESEATWIVQPDIFYRDLDIMAFIGSKSIEGNDHHPIIVPIAHHEHLYDIPDAISAKIIQLSKRVAIGLKEVRGADGVTVIQNNEPAADQHAFHYHMHVIPRFEGDNFHNALWSTERSRPEDRKRYADDLRDYLKN